MIDSDAKLVMLSKDVENKMCSTITTALRHKLYQYWHHNGSESDLQNIKHGMIDLCNFVQPMDISVAEKKTIGFLIVSLAFNDFKEVTLKRRILDY